MEDNGNDNPEGSGQGTKPKVVSLKKRKQLTVAERALEKLPELESYLKGAGKDCAYVIIFTDGMRIGIGVGEPCAYVGLLEFEKRDFIETLPDVEE